MQKEIKDKKVVELTETQNKRFEEIQERLWQISKEDNDLREEVKAMGITHDWIGHMTCEIVVKK